jgi:hypothetical protein
MTSLRKIEANRRNARFSTGPRSPGGRARARRNALKSGIYAKTALLSSENAAAYAALRVQVFQHYEPEGPIEEGLVELIIADLWRLNRLLRIENEFIFHTRATRARREKNSGPSKSIGAFLDELRKEPEGAPSTPALPGNTNIPRAGALNSDFEKPNTEEICAASLLDAHVSPVSQAPMEDIARQRRQTNREMLRNIAALNVLRRDTSVVREPYAFALRSN